jgi:hypothetical protein
MKIKFSTECFDKSRVASKFGDSGKAWVGRKVTLNDLEVCESSFRIEQYRVLVAEACESKN